LVDVFEEVEEQLRADRYRAMLLKAWPWALGAVVAGLLAWLAFWGWGKYQADAAAKASTAYVQAMEAMSKGDAATAEKAFVEIGRSSAKGYKALGLMQQAGMKLQGGDNAEAVKLFDQAAAAATNPLIADAARLKAAYVLLDTAPLADIEKRLAPLADAKRPFSLLAKEALATARLMGGNAAQAKTDFAVLSIAPGATDSMRQRAQAAILMIDSGQTAGLPQLVKQAAARPELPVVPQVIPPAEAGNTQ
jgi:hypothetical protein